MCLPDLFQVFRVERSQFVRDEPPVLAHEPAVRVARRLAETPGLGWLAPLGALAWPWYVPLGTALTLLVGFTSSTVRRSLR